MAAVPPHVSLGCGEVAQRRRDMAQPHRSRLSLPDAASTNSACLVCAPDARLVPTPLNSHGVESGALRSVPHLHAAASSPDRILWTGAFAAFDSAHRELCVLQSAGTCAL